MLLAAAHGSCAPSHLRVLIIAAGGVTLVMSIASASLRAATKSRVRVVLLSYARLHDCGAKSIKLFTSQENDTYRTPRARVVLHELVFAAYSAYEAIDVLVLVPY